VEVFRDDGSQVYPDYERYTLQTAKAYDKLYETKVDPEGNPITDSSGRFYPDGQMEGPLGSAHLRR